MLLETRINLQTIAKNLKNDIPKIYLKRIDLNTISSLNKSFEKGNQKFFYLHIILHIIFIPVKIYKFF